ncbi:TVP38/TMEM64 family protein [Paenibacillus hodogayensis]|uniref:TVP38/TMEM64 family membrane protein n=1 Tax=Paenibacillus hodogayensis TaxID=279208 RepID=A0ABV5W208_9BACL
MGIAEILSSLTEEQLLEWLDKYRSFGPLPGIALAFLKSFVPPLPTLLIVGGNAIVYGLWLGFLYSWIGMASGCIVTFLLVRKVAGHRYLQRWADKPKVKKAMQWVRRNAFSYVFLLSLFPVGPFVVINIAAGLAGMRLRSFALAVSAGKAIMIFAVSYIGYDVNRYIEDPLRLVYVVLFIVASLIVSRKIEARFAKQSESTGAAE